MNIGWLKHIRTDAPAQVMSEGTEGSGKIYVDTADGDYKNLDALVFDAVSEHDRALVSGRYRTGGHLRPQDALRQVFPHPQRRGRQPEQAGRSGAGEPEQIGGLKAVRALLPRKTPC